MKPLALDLLTLGPVDRPNHIYVLWDEQSGDAIVIDPAWNAGKLRDFCDARSLNVRGILLTHSHGDHCNAADELAELTGAPIHISAAESVFSMLDTSNYLKFEHSTKLVLGSILAACIVTPGHTPGSTCFYVDDRLFTGDTLFYEGCGYTHLKGGDPGALFDSLQMLKEVIPASCVVFPGHTFRSPLGLTFGALCEKNPYTRFQTKSAFSRFSGLRARFGKPR